MIILNVKVTEEDIRKDKNMRDSKFRDTTCAIASALNRTLKVNEHKNGYHFEVNGVTSALKHGAITDRYRQTFIGRTAWLPEKVKQFIRRADNNEPVQPIEFDFILGEHLAPEDVTKDLFPLFRKATLKKKGKIARVAYSKRGYVMEIIEVENGIGTAYIANDIILINSKRETKIPAGEAEVLIQFGYPWTWNLDGNAGNMIFDLRDYPK